MGTGLQKLNHQQKAVQWGAHRLMPQQQTHRATHARRKFDEALQVLSPEARKDSQAAVGECYCSKLFHIEQQLAALTPEQRYSKRLEQEKPVLDAMLAWANELMPKTAGKSALGKALHYLLEQWPYLVRYLEDGRLELSNNRAERSIKPFVMGRNYALCQIMFCSVAQRLQKTVQRYRRRT